jgi:hypothetical protein
MTTVYQFLKISELLEANRQASLNFGKLSRNISVELNLPVKDRASSGAEFVKICRSELDRLIEQSPVIDPSTLELFESRIKEDVNKPEIVNVRKVEIFEDQEAKTGNIVASAADKFSGLLKLAKAKMPPTPTKAPPKTIAEKSKEDINRELDVLSKGKIVSAIISNTGATGGGGSLGGILKKAVTFASSPKSQQEKPVSLEIPEIFEQSVDLLKRQPDPVDPVEVKIINNEPDIGYPVAIDSETVEGGSIYDTSSTSAPLPEVNEDPLSDV